MPPIDADEILFVACIILFVVATLGFILMRPAAPTCDPGFVMVKGMCVQGYDPRKPR